MERARTGFMDKPSALSLYKRTNGLNINTRNTVSGYITLCKIKKALLLDFTQEMFKANEKQRSRIGKVESREARINYFIDKINDLPTDTIKGILSVYQAKGIQALMIELNRPMNQFSKTKTAEA